jgi:hypothetical protein
MDLRDFRFFHRKAQAQMMKQEIRIAECVRLAVNGDKEQFGDYFEIRRLRIIHLESGEDL